MLRYVTFVFAISLCYLTGGSPHVAFAQDAFKNKLRDLDRMRTEKTRDDPIDYDAVEKRGKELLAEFTAPEEQGQIYFHLVEIHGMTGMVHPDLVIQHAQSALALVTHPFQRLWLYVYWGGATRSANEHKPIEKQEPFFQMRRVAVKPYLLGLKEAQKYNVPDEMPSLPKGGNMLYDVTAPEGSPEYKQLQELKKKNDEQIAARQEAQYSRKLWIEHQALLNGVVELYSRPPYAASELREMATQILDNPKQVDALMKRIEANGALKDDPIPEKTNAAAQNR